MTNVAKAHSLSRINRAPVFLALIIAFAFVITPLAIHSQSGRQKPSETANSSNSNTRPRQIAKPASNQTNTQSAKPDKKEDNSDDSSDVVRVSSNLVAVPATVVDTRGVAVTNLKLEDFELRVDGQLNPISDISRAETPVRLAMLFDNSGSLSQSRDFEKHAAVRFFQNVMRPADEAAIYSVTDKVELAQ